VKEYAYRMKKVFLIGFMPSYYAVSNGLHAFRQARNQWGRRGETPLENFSPPLEKCVGHRLKLLDIVQNIWAHFHIAYYAVHNMQLLLKAF